MKHFWMTAAVGALCAFAVQASAATQSESSAHASRHHHLRGAEAAEHAGKSHKHAKGTHAKGGKSGKASSRKSAAKSKNSHHGPHGTHGRHEATVRSRREEAETPRHEGRSHSRHHATVVSDIKSEGGKSVKVGRHDTLATVARKSGVSTEELARLNRLHKPYHVRSGAYLKLPSRRYYVVKSGDTLYSLSRRFGVDAEDLSAFNSVGLGKPIRSGQKLYLPGEAADSNAPREPAPETTERPSRRASHPALSYAPIPYSPLPSTPQPSSPEPSPGQAPSGQAVQPFTNAPTQVPSTPPAVGPQGAASAAQPFQLAPAQPSARPGIIQTSPQPSAAEVIAAGRGKFVWPANGTLISVFGPKPDGQRNDGLNILANAGEPVRASADGQVVYAGDQVPSFGNLVLVKHDGGWVTAYAHMSKILVKNRDQVVQGQEVGEVGQTGSVDRPQLHFEIRYAASPKDKATPVDPGLLLPQH